MGQAVKTAGFAPQEPNVDLPGRSVRVNITLDEGMLRRIDRAAAASGESRSGFLVEAAKERLAAVA